MTEGRRTIKVNLGRGCAMCDEDPRVSLAAAISPRFPIYATAGKDQASRRLMICPIHDRADLLPQRIRHDI